MGCYVNPENSGKENWLNMNSEGIFSYSKVNELIKENPKTTYEMLTKDDCLPVVLLDNIIYTAAGVCYNFNEFLRFLDERDSRYRVIYRVKIDKLKDVSPVLSYMKYKES